MRFLSDEAEGGALQNTIALTMPTAREQLDINSLEKALNAFQSVSLELQKKAGAVNLLAVCVLFDCLIETYGGAFAQTKHHC